MISHFRSAAITTLAEVTDWSWLSSVVSGAQSPYAKVIKLCLSEADKNLELKKHYDATKDAMVYAYILTYADKAYRNSLEAAQNTSSSDSQYDIAVKDVANNFALCKSVAEKMCTRIAKSLSMDDTSNPNLDDVRKKYNINN